MDAPTEPLKIHLYRVQDVDALRRAGNLRGRNFANLDAFCHLLLARGYVVFEPGQTPLEFLVDALSRAGVIVGIHGAGLANFVFSPPGTRIYEITGEDDTWRFLEAASAVLGHDFTRVRQSGSPDPEKPSLNIAQLARTLP
jgi:capsular polysaccharide biosynthesis protein